ncbi:MAG: type IV secretion system protein [Gammaproteobacteria bacterium]|nr:MAG: type IV secretion system protein [Gammaproteobacteria bacterium]
MGFFTEFSQWLDAILASYIAGNTARVAALLEPAIVGLGTLYVAIWGYLQLAGKVEEPFVEGARRLLTLALILGLCLQLWLYNTVIVDTFFTAPAALAAGLIGAFNSAGVVDQVFFDGSDVASQLLAKGGLFEGAWSFSLAGFAVYLIVGLTAIYTMFLLSLSKIALSILIALGPLFIALLFFESTKRFMGAWIAQLANYAFITILTVLAAALMLQVVTAAASQAMATGGLITIGSGARVAKSDSSRVAWSWIGRPPGGIVSRARRGFRFSAACARSSGAITRSGQEGWDEEQDSWRSPQLVRDRPGRAAGRMQPPTA